MTMTFEEQLTNATTDDVSGDVVEESAPAPAMGVTRPSMWSTLWAAIALFWLMFARRWFSRLG